MKSILSNGLVGMVAIMSSIVVSAGDTKSNIPTSVQRVSDRALDTGQLFRVTTFDQGVTLFQTESWIPDLYGSAIAVAQKRDSCLLLTAAHVVVSAKRIEVDDTEDGQPGHLAEVVALDESLDMGLLKVLRSDSLPCLPVKIAKNKPARGDEVTLFGNPVGTTWIVSQGIISGTMMSLSGQHGWLMTDAAAAPGFSGGAAILSDGSLGGLVVSTLSTTVPTGFTYLAQPHDINKFLQQVGVFPLRSNLGITGIRSVDLERHGIRIALPDEVAGGVIVEHVTEGSRAAKAGLKGGAGVLRRNGIALRWGGNDLIVMANGQPLRTREQIEGFVSRAEADESVQLLVLRGERLVNISLPAESSE